MRDDQQTRHIPTMIRRASQTSTIQLEEEELDANIEVEPEPEGWEIFCAAIENTLKLLTNEEADWSVDRWTYKPYLEQMLNQLEEIRCMQVKPKTYDVNINNFTPGQRMAYDIISKHRFGQLLLQVFGSAGTRKSHLIKALMNKLRGSTKVTATTGSVAFNIDETTIPSALHLPI